MNQDRSSFLVVAGVTIATTVPFSARSAEKTKIGIIGSGKAGSALGTTWVKAGHEVMFSSPFRTVRCLTSARTWRAGDGQTPDSGDSVCRRAKC